MTKGGGAFGDQELLYIHTPPHQLVNFLHLNLIPIFYYTERIHTLMPMVKNIEFSPQNPRIYISTNEA